MASHEPQTGHHSHHAQAFQGQQGGGGQPPRKPHSGNIPRGHYVSKLNPQRISDLVKAGPDAKCMRCWRKKHGTFLDCRGKCEWCGTFGHPGEPCPSIRQTERWWKRRCYPIPKGVTFLPPDPKNKEDEQRNLQIAQARGPRRERNYPRTIQGQSALHGHSQHTAPSIQPQQPLPVFAPPSQRHQYHQAPWAPQQPHYVPQGSRALQTQQPLPVSGPLPQSQQYTRAPPTPQQPQYVPQGPLALQAQQPPPQSQQYSQAPPTPQLPQYVPQGPHALQVQQNLPSFAQPPQNHQSVQPVPMELQSFAQPAQNFSYNPQAPHHSNGLYQADNSTHNQALFQNQYPAQPPIDHGITEAQQFIAQNAPVRNAPPNPQHVPGSQHPAQPPVDNGITEAQQFIAQNTRGRGAR